MHREADREANGVSECEPCDRVVVGAAHGTALAFSIPRRSRARHRRGARSEELVTGERLLISVVDDDESVRESLPALLRELGFAAQAFPSAEAFLASEAVGETSCLILDIAMPGMSGPDLQQELRRRRREIPIIFITGQGDDTVRPRLLAHGAVECLFKPFSDTALLEALDAAFRMR
jgi:CheY-like chemotaxis protein